MQSRREFLGQAVILAGGLILPAGVEAAAKAAAALSYDVVIYGGTSAAVTAAIQTARMGKSVAIVCPETHLGGMTTSGLGWTDTKQVAAIGGLAREFYHRIWLYYQNPEVWTRQKRSSYLGLESQSGPAMDDKSQVMWTFEPHVAEEVMEKWLAEEKIAVHRGQSLNRKNGVVKQGARIVEIAATSGRRFRGKVFIDAGYEGDLMAAAGVRYRIGRDSAEEHDEPLNGIRFMVKGVDRYYNEDEYRGVDPYITPGVPKSGFISGIEGVFDGKEKLGQADHRLQSFNYRLCMTNDPGRRVYISKPQNYDERLYEILFRLYAAGQTSSFSTQPMPNNKTDSNAKGAMSFDFIGGDSSLAGHWNYSEADDKTRRKIVAAHRNYQQGLLWTLQNHPRIPASTRNEMGKWGLDAEEFESNGHWPYQLYVREARRMIGQTMVTQHHVQRKPGYDVADSIGLGSYSLDSHIVRRVVVDGKIQNEGGFYVWWTTPYPIPYGAVTPKRAEAINLLVPVTLSATHAAFGSFRMEPTYMILGQAAATAAALAIDRKSAVQDVDYTALSQRLAADGQVLTARRPPAA
jgi:hypothetical protein